MARQHQRIFVRQSHDVVRSMGRAVEAKGLYEQAIALREAEDKEDPSDETFCCRRRSGGTDWPDMI